MTENTIENSQAIQFLRISAKNDHKGLNPHDYEELMLCIEADFCVIPTKKIHAYLHRVFDELPYHIVPDLIDHLIVTYQNGKYSRSLAYFLLTTERPIYQLKALRIIKNTNDAFFAPFILPLIFSNYQPLQQESVETLIKNKGNVEFLLEHLLHDHSPEKRDFAAKLLLRINPQNVKAAIYMLGNQDFLQRINAINILANTKERKWIPKIAVLLNDPDLAVQKASIEAIAELGGNNAKNILESRLAQEAHLPLREILQKVLKKNPNNDQISV